MNDAEYFKTRPNPKDPAVQARIRALRNRMIADLASQLPDDWLANANAKDRNELMVHMVTSQTMQQILDIVTWTVITIEKEEEVARAQSSK